MIAYTEIEMALLPTIPTSFVPHMASVERRSARADFGSAFGYLAYGVLGIVFLLALGIFLYGRVLDANKATKDKALLTAEAGIDPATISSFVQLRDRLNSGQALLNNHIAVSGFFGALEKILPSTVRFTALHIIVDTAGGATKVEGTGVSKSFNALSVASGAFAKDGRIKDAIFSKMSINKDSSVSFGFSATLDPKLLIYTPTPAL